MTCECDEIEGLSMAQRAALRAVEETASRLEADASRRLATDLRNCGCTDEMFKEAMWNIRVHSRVAVHFHPDRFGLKPTTVAESLLNEGFYQNQFETGLSSGGRSASPNCLSQDGAGISMQSSETATKTRDHGRCRFQKTYAVMLSFYCSALFVESESIVWHCWVHAGHTFFGHWILGAAFCCHLRTGPGQPPGYHRGPRRTAQRI
jgi:hypothetical protein